MTAIPTSLKHVIAAGIGLLVATIGLKWGGVIVAAPGTLVALSDLHSRPVAVALGGLTLTAVLMARRVPGALVWGILGSTTMGLVLGIVRYEGIVSAPPSIGPTWLQLDVRGALAPEMIPVVLVFFLIALFDSVGTWSASASRPGSCVTARCPGFGRPCWRTRSAPSRARRSAPRR